MARSSCFETSVTSERQLWLCRCDTLLTFLCLNRPRPVSGRSGLAFSKRTFVPVSCASAESASSSKASRSSCSPSCSTHAGEIVTGRNLQQQIWGSETVVNFDHSLGTAVNKVREALGDSAENPHYIETLAKRGYRFIAPVQAAGVPSRHMPVSKAVPHRKPSRLRRHRRRREPEPSEPAAGASPWRLVAGRRCRDRCSPSSPLGSGRPAESIRPTLLPFTQITSSDSIFPGRRRGRTIPGAAH